VFNNIYEYEQKDFWYNRPNVKRLMDDTLAFPLTDGDKGLKTWYLAFGNNAVEKPSNLVTFNRIVCGKELVTLTEDGPIEISAERAGADDDVHDIPEDTYKGWFKIDTSNLEETDPTCGETKYYVGKETGSGAW
jgi:hypothetical protein